MKTMVVVCVVLAALCFIGAEYRGLVQGRWANAGCLFAAAIFFVFSAYLWLPGGRRGPR